jgi:enoyl-CoA hydratase
MPLSEQSEKMIKLEWCDTIVLVTLNCPTEQNTLNLAMVGELTRIFIELQNDPGVRTVILTGAGKTFSAGSDIEEMTGWTPEQAKEFARAGQQLTCLLENLGKPVIAAVNGLASGSGCELALACTWRVASANAVFAQPEASMGFLLGFGGATRLPKLIGKARALEMILIGNPITVEEALRIGLVNRILDQPKELLPFCLGLAHQISRNAPLAMKFALETVNRGSELPLADGLQLESALFGLCFATEDVQEGTKAFLEKRPPIFKGQ